MGLILDLNRTPNLKDILITAANDIKEAIPEFIRPKEVLFEISDKNELVIKFDLGVQASSIIYGAGPQNLHEQTESFTPPLDPLLEWVKRKGVPNDRAKGRAFYIQRKIAGKIDGKMGGTPPHTEYLDYYNKAVNSVMPFYENQINDALSSDVPNLLDFSYRGKSLIE